MARRCTEIKPDVRYGGVEQVRYKAGVAASGSKLWLQTQDTVQTMAAKLLTILFLIAGASAQATAPQWGQVSTLASMTGGSRADEGRDDAQCGGQGWTGATACPAGWVCTVSNQYYSQCLQGAASASVPPTGPSSNPPASQSAPVGGGPSGSSSAAVTLPTLVAGNSFIRAVVRACEASACL